MPDRGPWILAVLLAVLAGFVASTFGTWIPVIASTLIAVVSVVAQRRHATQKLLTNEQTAGMRPWLKSALVVLAAIAICVLTAFWRLGNYLAESINPIQVGVDILAHAAILVSLMIWVARGGRGHVTMLMLGMSILLMCVAAGGTSQSLVAQTTIGLCACVGFAAASQVILSQTHRESQSGDAIALPHASITQRPIGGGNSPRRTAEASRRMAPLFSLLTVSLILMATSAVAKVTSEALPGVRDNLHEQLKSTLDAVNDESIIGGTRYVRGDRLGGVRKHMLANPQEIALTTFADRAPGYLRGTVYDHYRRRRWRIATNTNLPPSRRTPAVADRTILAAGRGRSRLHTKSARELSRFRFANDVSGPSATIEIVNDPMKGTVVFLPLGTQWVEASGSELIVSHHNVIRLGVDITNPYVAGVGRSSGVDTVEGDRRRLLLMVPGDLDETASRITGQICAPQMDARAKAKAIEDFFGRDFSYSMNETPAPDGVDPVRFFLETKPPAHCEYFASASVILLRSAGVPARYVTGYVATEYREETEAWLARNRDAHAWAEAFDERSGTWFPVESTPGRNYLTIQPDGSQQSSSLIGTDVETDGLEDDESLLGRFWSWLTSMRATDPLMVFFRFAQLPLFCVLVFLLWYRFWREDKAGADPIDVACHKMLRRADRACRKQNLTRMPQETLHQFATRIDSRHSTDANPDTSKLPGLARWYRDYADARYRGEMPAAWDGGRS